MAYGSAIYKSVGSVASGTTGLSVTYPAGIVEGNLVVMCTVWKASSGNPSMNTPSGWQQQDAGYTQFNAGQGTQGNVDVGPVHSSIFYRIATGSLTGSVTLGWSSAVSSCQSVIIVLTKPLDCEWGSMFGLVGYDVDYGTSWIQNQGLQILKLISALHIIQELIELWEFMHTRKLIHH